MTRVLNEATSQRRRTRALALVIAAVLAAAVTALADAAAPRRPDVAAVARDVVPRTNAFRERNGLAPVAADETLTGTAQRFAEYMARTERYGHDADGHVPAERVSEAGYAYCLVAENIGYQMSTLGFTTAELATRLVEGWEQSPAHRRNMLLALAVDIGVGVAYSPRTQRYYAVQLFGRPKSAAARFEIANRAGATVQYEIEGQTYALDPRVTRTHEGCFEGTLKMQWPNGSTSAAVQPQNGARYVVARDDDGQWRLTMR